LAIGVWLLITSEAVGLTDPTREVLVTDRESDAVFAGSVPEVYERCLVPLIFECYADDLVERVARLTPGSVLEIAAGTGVVTRALASGLEASVEIMASDLNADMIEHAAAVGTSRPVEWRQADVMQLPFPDDAFDVVVCQFSAMFFPDRPGAYAEINRVLRSEGTLVFSVWDDIANNEFADVVTDAVGELFPDDPPLFLARTPHGYHDEVTIRSDLAAGGFTGPASIESLEHRSLASTAELPAFAYCHGTPLRGELEQRDPGRLDEATEHATTRLSERFGSTDLDSKIRGFVITATTA
jgi:SAM-dependent methyltransferase